jgi:hypothetical protein
MTTEERMTAARATLPPGHCPTWGDTERENRGLVVHLIHGRPAAQSLEHAVVADALDREHAVDVL